jgi:hypothetical protein
VGCLGLCICVCAAYVDTESASNRTTSQ